MVCDSDDAAIDEVVLLFIGNNGVSRRRRRATFRAIIALMPAAVLLPTLWSLRNNNPLSRFTLFIDVGG